LNEIFKGNHGMRVQEHNLLKSQDLYWNPASKNDGWAINPALVLFHCDSSVESIKTFILYGSEKMQR
jgi:hypothetical protein